jgi:hypothetical protein
MNKEKKIQLKEALLEAQVRDFSLFPTEEELDKEVIFSLPLQRYIHKLATLADKKERKFIYLGLCPIRKVVAVVIILLVLSAPVTVPAITKGIIHIVQMIYKDHVQVHHAIPLEQMNTIPTEIEFFCEPTWMPIGYKLQERSQDNNHSCLIYSSGGNDVIYFLQHLLSDTGAYLDSDESILKEVMIRGIYPGLCSNQDDYSSLTWNDGYYQYQLIGPLDYENIVKIANSVVPIVE